MLQNVMKLLMNADIIMQYAFNKDDLYENWQSQQ